MGVRELISVWFALIWAGDLAQAASPRSAPNIVFICTDDQGVWTPGVYGNKQAETPHMDQLARAGARLTNAFATAPVCSASRASLFTGRYSSEHGIHDAISPQGSKTHKETIGRGLGAKGLSSHFLTFPRVLASTGYKTGLVGKWHLGETVTDRRFHPLNHGFHYFMGMPQGGAKPLDPLLEENGVVSQFRGFIDDILVDRAIRFIEENAGRPFLLNLHLRAPHRAYLPIPEEIWARYRERDVEVPMYPDLDVPRAKTAMREYLAALANLDRNLGDVLGALDRLQLASKTIVIVTSDHGYSIGHHGLYEKGNGVWLTRTPPPGSENIWPGVRPNVLDTSLRVPAIIRWPGVIRPNSVISRTVSGVDWFPTIVEMAGATIPAGTPIRGRSIVPLLRGEPVPDWNDDLYAEYNIDNNSHARLRTIRSGGWKLVRDFLNSGRDELYHLAADPSESRNRITDREPEIVAIRESLERKLLHRMDELHDPVRLTAR